MAASEKLRQAAGRLIVGKVPGTILDDESKHLFASGIMGGVTFFKDNADNLSQLSNLVYDIVEAYAAGTESIPFITVDQEGGAVQRFDNVITPLPSAMALAAGQSTSPLREITAINAQELKLLGFNCLLAPVLDLVINEKNPIVCTRAFGDQIDAVSAAGKIVIETLNSQGMLAAGKHFPGHGGTSEDTHLSLAVNSNTLDQLSQSELEPFRKTLNSLPSMLTSHVWFNEIDKEPLPASLSYKITTELLRNKLKFDRLVITDDLLMKAITNKWGLGEAAVMAVEAGADILLTCGTAQEIKSVHEAIVAAVESGRITEERLEKSLTRLERALLPLSKERYLNIRAGRRQDSIEKLQAILPRNRKVAFEAAQKAICQLRGSMPNLTDGQWTIVAPNHQRYKIDLASFLNAAGLTVNQIRYELNPTTTDCERIKEKLSGQNCIYLTFRTAINDGQIQLGHMLKNICHKTLGVAVDVPFDANHLPHWDNYIATFDPSDLAIEALSSMLCNQQKLQGVCPTTLNAPSIK